MPRKHYYLSGPSFTVDDEEVELHCTFDEPRVLKMVTITHAGFSIDHEGNPPPQLLLRSAQLAAVTQTRGRELSKTGVESLSNILGHVALVQDTTNCAHYELQHAVGLNFGTNPRKIKDFEFFLTDHRGYHQRFLMDVTDSILRYTWSGDWTLNPTEDDVELTQTWGPSEGTQYGSVGGGMNFPATNSTWSFNYNNGTFTLKWEDDNAQKIYGVWNTEMQAFTWTSDYGTGWGLTEGDPILTYKPWTESAIEVPNEEQVLEAFPYASVEMTVDALH